MKIFIYLMLIVFSVTIFGKDSVSLEERDERRVDYESNSKDIINYEKKNKIEENNDNEHEQPIKPTEEELKKFDKYVEGTKNASDFEHLERYNLSDASFENLYDENNYKWHFINNTFVPQGLTIDNNGYLLISMYDRSKDYRSIVVRYNPAIDRILNVYTLYDMDKGSHVGGIGYYHKSTGEEFIFLQNKNDNPQYIRIYRIYFNGAKYFIKESKVGHTTSTVSTSYGYLWTAPYKENSNTNNELSGYKINFSNINNWTTIYLGLQNVSGETLLVPNYDIKQPKGYIQGLYCDTNPEENKRLKFYFTASTFSYVYQALLVTKDIDNDGQIGEGEYYWESFYTPNEYAEDEEDDLFTRRLPLGVEGIVKKDDKLWVLNEGFEYCGYWSWKYGSTRVDCANEILVVDSIYTPTYPSGTKFDIFPSGEIQISGSGLQDWGYKVAIVYAQNKDGYLYYSIGEFNCNNNLCKMYLDEPTSKNPIGAIYNSGDHPKVFVEDIKGIYFMNLNQTGYPGDSDDFYMYSFMTIFDSTESLFGLDNYVEYINIYKEFGDNNTNSSIGDKEAMFLSFDFRYGTNDLGELIYQNGYGTYYDKLYQEIFLPLRGCYDYYGVSGHNQCRSDALWNMEDSIYYSSSWFLGLLNNYINRFHNIID